MALDGNKVIMTVCLIIGAIALLLFGNSLSFLFPLDMIPLINYLSIFLIVIAILIMF